jgi:HD superfamily phosphohydrolase
MRIVRVHGQGDLLPGFCKALGTCLRKFGEGEKDRLFSRRMNFARRKLHSGIEQIRNMDFRPQRIRDPVHNLIEFQADEFDNAMWRVVQTRAFQRLRRVKQLGFSDLVFPGATHSRFAHALGAFQTARQLMTVIERHMGTRSFEPTPAHVALAASLVHDLGHGPFSHAFEDVGRRLGLQTADHEYVTNALIRHSEVNDALRPLGSGFANDVADVIKRSGPGSLYDAVVSSQFDADRLDYMRRDRLMTGSEHAAIDFTWLVANLQVGEVEYGVDDQKVGTIRTFVLGPKAVHAAEAYVLGLFQLYPTVYYHKATRAAEKIFIELMVRVISLIAEGSTSRTALPENHPIVRFAKEPSNLETVLLLDDAVVWGALSLLADAPDSAVSSSAIRLRDRQLYKCIDVRTQLAEHFGEQAAEPSEKADGSGEDTTELVDRLCASINEKVNEWLSGNVSDTPRILTDQAIREPYKRFQESKGPLNQIRIKTESDVLVDLGERSRIVRAIQPFRVFRLYFGEADDEARTFINELVRGAKNGTVA